jgi:endonuclease/exonuclease/phosphatase family metal-dependent hydrolase
MEELVVMKDFLVRLKIKKGIILLIGLMFLSIIKLSAQNKQFEFKIMSYNIRHASPPSRPNQIDVDTVAGVIRKYQPDLVALQEVDVFTKRSGKTLDEANEIGKKAGMNAYFAKAINYSEGEYGVAILSRYPMDSFAVYALPSANEKSERRTLAVGFFHIKKKSFCFACTHLDAEGSNASRMMQIKFIDSVLGLLRVPVVLAGDLNSEEGSAVIQYLDKNFLRTCIKSCGLTFPSDAPVKTIDYISVHKSSSCQVVQHSVLPESFPSDHLSILADVKIRVNKHGVKKGL